MRKIFLLLFVLPLFLTAQTSKTEATYKTKQFSITYPEHWMLNDSGENGTTFFLYSTTSETADVFTENINLITQPVNDASITLEGYKKMVEQQISNTLNNPEISFSKIKTSNGIQSHQLFAKGTSSGYQFKTIVYTFIKNQKIFMLTFVTLLQSYPNNHQEAIKIMDSFKLFTAN